VADSRIDQRLAAILAADVAGYSRLMEADERATVANLDACRAVFQELSTERGGRIVDTAGDSVLAVFPSAIGAVEAALAIQDELGGRDAALPEERRMRFRIGVNLGDVIEKPDGSVYGSGVNVAARLEGLAEPGGICISGNAYEQVDGKLDVAFQDFGEHEVKNIVRPVRVWRVVGSERMAPVEAPAPSDRPSIAVLAFENLSGDAEQNYLADGIAEDLITELSRLRWLQVTARNSSFTYRGQAVDLRQVGRELGARYVVEGSVRKGGKRVRISAQLIDTGTGNHIWAERHDREFDDIFALQDEITETLVAALQAEVGEFERELAHRKPPGSLNAWEFYQRGLWHLWQFNADDLAEARRLFQRATELDPGFAQAFSMLGFALCLQVILSYTDDPLETLQQALQFGNTAITLDDREAMGHFAVGRVRVLLGEYDIAVAELRTSIDLNPSSAVAHMVLGMALWLTGQFEQAVAATDTAIRLSPRDPYAWGFYTYRGLARFSLGDHEAAVEDARRAIQDPAASFWPHALMASALALLDRSREAKIALNNLMNVRPDFTVDTAPAALSPLDPEALRPQFKMWVEGLQKAGLDISAGPFPAD
jgi:TolB-like protein/class 3 adenylate cyclase/tetratricopeptide (TPR) repeat protein